MKDNDIIGYVVLKMCRWEDLEMAGPFLRGAPVVAPDGQIGYMPIYADMEALVRDWPNATIHDITPIRRRT